MHCTDMPRVAFSTTMELELSEQLTRLSKTTMIPKAKLIEKALVRMFNEYAVDVRRAETQGPWVPPGFPISHPQPAPAPTAGRTAELPPPTEPADPPPASPTPGVERVSELHETNGTAHPLPTTPAPPPAPASAPTELPPPAPLPAVRVDPFPSRQRPPPTTAP